MSAPLPVRPAADRPEISDLVVSFDPDTLARVDVERDRVLGRFEELAMREALSIVSRWPHTRGVLDPQFIDDVLLRSHLELQRLSEEFQQGGRVLRLLRPLVKTLAQARVAPLRIVDVGCGLGYVIRWLAAHGALHGEVQLLGCDFNTKLIDAATKLAAAESLACTFSAENAFRLRTPATVFTSTGVIHHFRGEGLDRFFGQQRESGALAFIHSDIKPSWLAPLGSWIFHHARMREPLARHDGVLSAIRAHDGRELLRAARVACPGWKIGLFDAASEVLPVLRVMQAVVGIRADLADAWLDTLGPIASRIEGLR